MENVTITIFVEPDSLLILMASLKILDDLDIDNNYTIQHLDITYSEKVHSHWNHINIPIVLYLNFKNCYKKSGGTVD